MAERNDMTAALVTAYTSPQLAAINEYLEAEKAVRTAAEILGLDADLMIAEAEGLARATTFSNVEALYFVADQAASGKPMPSFIQCSVMKCAPSTVQPFMKSAWAV